MVRASTAYRFATLASCAFLGSAAPHGTPTSTWASDAADLPVVEVLTMSPGEALYTRWGHAALRVLDPRTKLDAVYNYGSIDLSPGFMRRMLKGEVEAFLHVGRYDDMFETYAEKEDRTIERRRLNLDWRATERLIRRLRNEARGPRWTYRYDHFADNCSSRVADVIDDALQGALSSAYSSPHRATYRQLALSVLEGHPGLYVAVDTALSPHTDAPISRWDSRFLPSELASLLDDATIDGRPLVREKEEVYRSKNVWIPHATHPWPWLWVYVFVTLPLLGCAFRWPRVASAILGLTTSLIGLGLWVLQLGTTYPFLLGNANLIVFPVSNVLILVGVVCSGKHSGQPSPLPPQTPLPPRSLTSPSPSPSPSPTSASRPLRRWGQRALRIYWMVWAGALVALCGANISGVVTQCVLPQCLALLPVVFFLAFRRSSPGR
ncbi:MAG: DUF4105 domain-containing protein [Deltaproteobacteria bacterium]|nr:DUF4105 domain-containing protein [Deltaproteobacteria bacterium]